MKNILSYKDFLIESNNVNENINLIAELLKANLPNNWKSLYFYLEYATDGSIHYCNFCNISTFLNKKYSSYNIDIVKIVDLYSKYRNTLSDHDKWSAVTIVLTKNNEFKINYDYNEIPNSNHFTNRQIASANKYYKNK